MREMTQFYWPILCSSPLTSFLTNDTQITENVIRHKLTNGVAYNRLAPFFVPLSHCQHIVNEKLNIVSYLIYIVFDQSSSNYVTMSLNFLPQHQ